MKLLASSLVSRSTNASGGRTPGLGARPIPHADSGPTGYPNETGVESACQNGWSSA